MNKHIRKVHETWFFHSDGFFLIFFGVKSLLYGFVFLAALLRHSSWKPAFSACFLE